MINSIASVSKQAYRLFHGILLVKYYAKNTLFKFAVVDNSDIFDGNGIYSQDSGNRRNRAGFVDQVKINAELALNGSCSCIKTVSVIFTVSKYPEKFIGVRTADRTSNFDNPEAL